MEIAIVVLTLLGLLAGWSGRRLLARLRRGVVVRGGPCELTCGALFCLVGVRWADGLPSWWVPVPLALAAMAVPLAAVDLLRRRLPNLLTASAVLGLGSALVAGLVSTGEPELLVRASAGSVVFGGAHLVVHRLAPTALGGGDAKLAVSLGGVLGAVGWQALVVAACLASVITLVLAGGAVLLRFSGWRSGVPHGPGLLAATWLISVFPGTGLGVA